MAFTVLGESHLHPSPNKIAPSNAGWPPRLHSDAMGPAWLRFAFGVSMHLYLRIVLDAKSEDYSGEEEKRLRDCVQTAPGIETVKKIERHTRGGYSVTAERVGDTLEEIVLHLSASGYRLVI